MDGFSQPHSIPEGGRGRAPNGGQEHVADIDAPVDIIDRLRRETASAHRGLEQAAGISRSHVSQARIRFFLERLYGFYHVWEPWLAASAEMAEIASPLCKSAILADDLRALGIEPEALPVYPHPLGKPRSEAVLGSLYVMEGAMLGGRVIRRWIDGEPWTPDGGIGYFNGYGEETGHMWRTFQLRFRLASREDDHDAIVASANETFRRLQGWLGRKEDI